MPTEPPARPPSSLILGTSHLAFGRPALPGSVTGAAAFSLLDRALDIGILALDTAAIYQFGGSERVIGNWLQRRAVRDRIYLISKGGHPSLLGHARLGCSDLEHDLNGSLRRLGTDRIDLYLLHRDASSTRLGPIAETLASFVTDGRIGTYGVSNWSHERFTALHTLALDAGIPLPVASSPQFSLPLWVTPPYPGCVSIGGPDAALALAAYREADAAVLAWSPLGSGWLCTAGGHVRDRAYRSRDNDARRARLTALAERIGCTPAQAALAYVLAHGSNVHAIVGTRRPERLAELHKGLALKLSPEQLSWLENGRAGGDPSDAPTEQPS